jgi:biopolymer transport protein ExbD
MATTTPQWRLRSEDAVGQGQPIEYRMLVQGISDGAWSEGNQVFDPYNNRWVPIGDHPKLQEFLPHKPLFAPKPAEEAEMDMTPMIDVTFQLIIFFMITAAFVVQKTLDMPEASPEQNDRPAAKTLNELAKENVIVKIDGAGNIAVDGAPVEIAELPDALREASKKNPDSFELILDVDDEVDYEVVVRVIDEAAGAKVQKVQFLRRRGPPADSATG